MTAICKSAFYHLRKISLIRKYLTFDAAQDFLEKPVAWHSKLCPQQISAEANTNDIVAKHAHMMAKHMVSFLDRSFFQPFQWETPNDTTLH